MSEKLMIGILGKSNAGKSTTIYDLYGRRTKRVSHDRPIWISDTEYVDAYLVTSSAEEQECDIEDLIEGSPRIVVCALQYRPAASKTIDFFVREGYEINVIWLNPGYDHGKYADSLGFVEYLRSHDAVVATHDGRQCTDKSVARIRRAVRAWARPRGLLRAHRP